MGALDKLADKLYGKKRLEVTASLASVSTDTYIGTAVSDSEDGNVQVIVSDDVTQPDHWQEFVTYGNLSPFLSHDLTDYGDESSDAYWNNSQAVVAALGSATQAEDGWAHFAGTESDMALAINAAQLEVEDGQEYTLLVELRNIVQAPNGSSAIKLSDSASAQIRGDGAEYQYADGIIRLVGEGNASAASGVHLSLCSGNSASYDFDMRLSLYTGVYEGGYFPYGEQEITQADLGTAINIPSTVAVKAGDKVLVTASGAEVITPMVVTGVVGRGDIQQAQIDEAQRKADSVDGIAQQALDVAEATGQYFWHNTGDEDVDGGIGAHVTQFKREEWSNPESENYHSGPNSLWNSLGMLFRSGLNNLLANLVGGVKTVTLAAEESYQFSYDLPDTASSVLSVTFAGAPVSSFSLEYNDDGTSRVLTSGEPYAQEGDAVVITYRVSPALAVFDGEGNGESNIVASFTAGCIELGKNTASAIIRLIDGLGIIKADANGLRIESPRGTNIFAGEVGGQFARIGGSVGTAAGAGMSLGNPASPNGRINFDFTCAKTGNTVYMASGSTSVNVTMLEFINSIRTASTTMNLSNVGSGTHTLSLYRQGHFVFASMSAAINPASANTAINAGTVPSGYRPAAFAMCSGAGMVSNTISNWFYRWRVAPTGAIVLHISVTGAREAPISMCWFTNDSWPS